MRKAVLFMLMLLAGIGLMGCKGDKDNISENQIFEADVLESGERLLVSPDENSIEYSSSDKISVATKEAEIVDENGNAIEVDILKPGDRVRIYYNGMIAESYPAQITADKIEFLEEAFSDDVNNGDSELNKDTTKANNESDEPDELGELEGVWMETEYEVYEVGVMTVRAKWFNSLDDSMMFGRYYILEENKNGTWQRVSKETDINYGFTSEGLILNSNETRWHSYGLIPYTDGLSAGEYRISTTFTRVELDGVEYGAGNYPNYQVYGYFDVEDESIKRNLTVLDDTKIEYLNEEYNFSIYLPKDWEGFQVDTRQETGDEDLDELFDRIDDKFVVMNIRHPKWTNEEPYQDISFVIFRAEQWNENVASAVNDDFDLLPLQIPGGGYKFILRSNPFAYNKALKGYDQVREIIGDGFSNSSISNY